MKLTNVREAACMQASYLINQISSKKGCRQVGNEIAKVFYSFNLSLDVGAFRP